jgi:hypothetical protein
VRTYNAVRDADPALVVGPRCAAGVAQVLERVRRDGQELAVTGG